MTEACSPPSSQSPSQWLIDGYNVIHAGLLGGRDRSNWWTEPRRQELLERAARFDGCATGAELWIVFDGAREVFEPEPEPESPGPHCVFAPSADTWLIERVRGAEDASQLVLVTADRQLADRARHRGAAIVPPRSFLSRCPS